MGKFAISARSGYVKSVLTPIHITMHVWNLATFFSSQNSVIVTIMMAADLAEFHSPVTDVFADAAANGDTMISEEQCAFYRDNGYLSGLRILDDAQIDALQKDLETIMSPGYAADARFYEYHHNESENASKMLFHALGAWRVSRAFHDLIFYERFVNAAAALLGGPVRFWHDQIFVKPAHDGGMVAWHQDYSYWTRTIPMQHLTCWIALDDSTIENGCVHYVPGSHRWDLLPRGPLANDMVSVLDLLTDEQKVNSKPVAIEIKAGEASFHHPMMLHGSYENRSDRPRRAAVLNVIRDGVMSNSDEPLLAGVPPIPKGEKISGRFFPLLT